MKAPGLASYQPVTLARSSYLSLLLLCKTGSWCLLGFVTHVFNKTVVCLVATKLWLLPACLPPPPPRAPFFAQEPSRMKENWRNLTWGVITAVLATEGFLDYSVPPMDPG